MAVRTKAQIKTFFETGDVPTESNFIDLIDSTYNAITDAQSSELTGGGVTDLHSHDSDNVAVDNSSFNIIESDNLQGALENIDLALLNARSTGVRYGGTLSINGSNSNTFDISELFGQILDNSDPSAPIFFEVSYTAKTGVVPAGEGINYIYYLPGDDTVYQTQTAPTYEDRKVRIYVGRATLRGGVLAAIPQDIDYVQQIGLQLRSLADAIGQIKISGLKVSANGANLSLNSTLGSMFDFGVNGQENPHEIDIPAKSAMTFQYVTQTSSITTDRVVLNPTQYDLNGTLTTLSNNRYSIQDVYFFSSGNVRIAYGQNTYNTLSDAKAALLDKVSQPNPGLSLGLRVASVILKKETTSLLNLTDSFIYNFNRFGL